MKFSKGTELIDTLVVFAKVATQAVPVTRV